MATAHRGANEPLNVEPHSLIAHTHGVGTIRGWGTVICKNFVLEIFVQQYFRQSQAHAIYSLAV